MGCPPPIREKQVTLPSNDELEMILGFLGHHCTSKLHWWLVGISYTTSPAGAALLGFQHRMRLSLAQLSSRSASWGHQAMLRIPLKKGNIPHKTHSLRHSSKIKKQTDIT